MLMSAIMGKLKTLHHKIQWKKACKQEGSIVFVDATMADPAVLRDSLVSWEKQSVPIGKIVVYLDKARASSFQASLVRARMFLPLEVRCCDPAEMMAQREWLSLSAEGSFSVLARGDVSYPDFTVKLLESEWSVCAPYVYASSVVKILEKSPIDCGIPWWGLEHFPCHDTVPLLSGGISVTQEAAQCLIASMQDEQPAPEEPFELFFKRLLLQNLVPVKALGWDVYGLRCRAPWNTGILVDNEVVEQVEGGYFDQFPDLAKRIREPHRSVKGNVLLMAGQADLCGANLSLHALYKHLLKLGEFAILVLPIGGQYEDLLRADRLPYYNLNVGAYQWVSPLGYSQEEEDARIAEWLPRMREGTKLVRKIIDVLGVDLVHENTSGSFMAASAAEQEHIGRIWHIREFNEEDHGQRLWPSMEPYRHFAESDACVCISRTIFRKYAERIGSDSMLRMIYNGIAIDDYVVLDHVPFKDPRNVVLACAGRICVGKGQKLLVEAVALLPEELRERVKVWLVGPRHDEDYCHQIEECAESAGISDQVLFKGVQVDMRSVWGGVDVAVVPSKFEAFGRCAVEAMLAGCLVIGNDTAGTAEIIENDSTGILFDQDSVNSLALKISDALRDVLRSQEIAANGRSFAQERFTSERNAQEVFQLHQEIVNRRRAGCACREQGR